MDKQAQRRMKKDKERKKRKELARQKETLDQKYTREHKELGKRNIIILSTLTVIFAGVIIYLVGNL